MSQFHWLVFVKLNTDQWSFSDLLSLSDAGLKMLLSVHSRHLEELALRNLNISLSQSLGESLKSPRILSVDLTNCPFVTDKGKLTAVFASGS